MKLSDIFEETMPKAESISDLLSSVKAGKFTKDGSHIEIYHGDFNCSSRELKSLVGMPKNINGNFVCINNNLTTLAGIDKIINEIDDGVAWFNGNPITSSVLGLLKIKGLVGLTLSDTSGIQPKVGKELDETLSRVSEIVSKHLHSKDVFACQEELIDAGLEEYAKL